MFGENNNSITPFGSQATGELFTGNPGNTGNMFGNNQPTSIFGAGITTFSGFGDAPTGSMFKPQNQQKSEEEDGDESDDGPIEDVDNVDPSKATISYDYL